MNVRLFFFLLCLGLNISLAQNVTSLDSLNLNAFEQNTIHKIFLSAGHDALGNTIKLPVLIARGSSERPVLGLTAAIHGNELNGIKIIHDVFDTLDVSNLKGTMIAVPGLNPLGITVNQRENIDGTDMNRIFPGKPDGNRSEQLVHHIATKLLPLFDYNIDLHTASFGRVNTLYGRGDMTDNVLAGMLKALKPDIVVSNKGKPSFGSAKAVTLRAYANSLGVKCITMEYGNPQVFQEEMIARGTKGVKDVMMHLNMLNGSVKLEEIKLVCNKSYWLYTEEGGFLEVSVELGNLIAKNQQIGVLRNSFGETVKEYVAPESGVVIGKSTNPVAISGSRIIHLGILAESE